MPDITGSNTLYTQYLVDSFRGGVHEPQTHTLKMGVLRSSYTPDKAHVDLSNVTADEVTGVNGYSRQTLNNVVIAQVGNWVTLQFDPVQFMASGGNWSGKYWVIFNDTPPAGPLVGFGQLDVNREDEIVIVDGKTIDVAANELGLYRLPV